MLVEMHSPGSATVHINEKIVQLTYTSPTYAMMSVPSVCDGSALAHYS